MAKVTKTPDSVLAGVLTRLDAAERRIAALQRARGELPDRHDVTLDAALARLRFAIENEERQASAVESVLAVNLADLAA
jgi:hypothetical protein